LLSIVQQIFALWAGFQTARLLMDLVDQRGFRIVCATHSPVLVDAPETYVINLDNHVKRNVTAEAFGVEGASTIQ
jgi:predicted ATPase